MIPASSENACTTQSLSSNHPNRRGFERGYPQDIEFGLLYEISHSISIRICPISLIPDPRTGTQSSSIGPEAGGRLPLPHFNLPNINA